MLVPRDLVGRNAVAAELWHIQFTCAVSVLIILLKFEKPKHMRCKLPSIDNRETL